VKWSIIPLLLLISLPSFAQHIILSKSQYLPDFTTEFYKQYTTWNWFSRIQESLRNDTPWKGYFSETLHSNLTTSSAVKKRWKDEHRFDGNFYRSLNNYDIGLYGHSWLQVNKQVSTDDKHGNHILGVFGRYNYENTVSIQPSLGKQNSRYRSLSEWGWDAGISGDVKNISVDEYDMKLDFRSEYDRYRKRRNSENYLDLSIYKEFSEYTEDSLSISIQETRKQRYTADGANIKEAKISQRYLANKLIYRFSPRSQLFLNTILASDKLDYLTDSKEFSIENQLRFITFSDNYAYGFTFRTYEENQDVANILSDNQRAQTTMGLNGLYNWNDNNTIKFNIAYIKFQHDTPEDNTDDRDEQRFILNLNYFRKINPYLSMEWLVYTYLDHQIYLFNPQSQNNKWNRIVKIQPRIHYRNGKLINKLSTSVLANYTVYDFEEQLENKTSFIFRKYMLSDSLQIPLYRRIHLVLLGRMELEDKGNFIKNKFEQILVQSYRSYLLNIYLLNESFLNMRVSLGYSNYLRRDWRHIPTKRMARKIINEGPFVNIAYDSSANLKLICNVTLNSRDDSNMRKSRSSTGYLKLYYNF